MKPSQQQRKGIKRPALHLYCRSTLLKSSIPILFFCMKFTCLFFLIFFFSNERVKPIIDKLQSNVSVSFSFVVAYLIKQILNLKKNHMRMSIKLFYGA